ncbi:MAG: glycerophosphoryl diester phosphodiesterase [Anaerolineaceae bacterium]|nr:MAG: glycerophosphoryl diester phosphodiesterase [Anaerolineaceae bacterium]
MKKDLLKANTGRILIESHRGAEGLAPENSWAALKLGSESSADFLETDVQLSRDGVAFLRHNYTLPDGRWCSSVPWAELKAITIEDEPLPLLEDLLVWAREGDLCLSLDLKVGFMPERRLVKEVLRLLERTQTQAHVMLISWDHVELLRIKLSRPDLTTRVLIRGRLVEYADFLKHTRADAVSFTYGVVRLSDVEQVHHAGVAVNLSEMWRPDFETVKDLDVDMVSWSDPNEARKMLGQ